MCIYFILDGASYVDLPGDCETDNLLYTESFDSICVILIMTHRIRGSCNLCSIKAGLFGPWDGWCWSSTRSLSGQLFLVVITNRAKTTYFRVVFPGSAAFLSYWC